MPPIGSLAVGYQQQFDPNLASMREQEILADADKFERGYAGSVDFLKQAGEIPIRANEQDMAWATKHLENTRSGLNDIVQKDYMGDWGAAAPALASRMSAEASKWSKIKNASAMAAQRDAETTKLEQMGKLILPKDENGNPIDPRKMSIFSEDGKIGVPDAKTFVRGDWEGYLEKNVSKSLNDSNQIGRIVSKYGYLIEPTTGGVNPQAWAEIQTNPEYADLNSRINEATKNFVEANKEFGVANLGERDTDYDVDKLTPQQVNEAKKYVLGVVQNQVGFKQQNAWHQDWMLEEAMKKKKEDKMFAPKFREGFTNEEDVENLRTEFDKIIEEAYSPATTKKDGAGNIWETKPGFSAKDVAVGRFKQLADDAKKKWERGEVSYSEVEKWEEAAHMATDFYDIKRGTQQIENYKKEYGALWELHNGDEKSFMKDVAQNEINNSKFFTKEIDLSSESTDKMVEKYSGGKPKLVPENKWDKYEQNGALKESNMSTLADIQKEGISGTFLDYKKKAFKIETAKGNVYYLPTKNLDRSSKAIVDDISDINSYVDNIKLGRGDSKNVVIYDKNGNRANAKLVTDIDYTSDGKPYVAKKLYTDNNNWVVLNDPENPGELEKLNYFALGNLYGVTSLKND